MSIVVKRTGIKEKFDEKKVYGSVYAACASAHYDELRCEKVSEEITKKVKGLVKKRKEIKSTEIRRKIVGELKKRDRNLAFFYEQHLPNLKKL